MDSSEQKETGYSSRVGARSELVKFAWERTSAEPLTDPEVASISSACDALDGHDLVTAYRPPAPPGSNGNLSCRRAADGGFLVTATQLASKRGLQAEDFVAVDRYENPGSQNGLGTAYYRGARLPSSESILHWYFYRRFPRIGAIVHVHENTSLLYGPASRAVWEGLGMIETARAGEAGTIDLPRSVDEVLTDVNKYVVLKGHYPEWDSAHTGTVVLADDLDGALKRVLDVHRGLTSAAA